jgi:hypothetical protein
MSMHLIGMHFVSVYIMGVDLVSIYHHNFSYNDPPSASARGVPTHIQQDLLGVGRDSPTPDTLALNSRIHPWPEFPVESTCPESP